MSAKVRLFIYFVIAFLITCFNVYVINPEQIKLNTKMIQSTNLPSEFDDYLIIYFSDLYYGNTDAKQVQKLIEICNELDPDCLIFGGDLLADSENIDLESEENLIKLLSQLHAKDYKLAVLGDNDTSEAIYILESSGFNILTNNDTYIYRNNQKIRFLGINENYEKEATDYFTIAFSHYGDNFNENNSYDLMLAGNSLGGQLYYPFMNYLQPLAGSTTYFKGTYQINNNPLTVSNGIGWKEKRLRFCADADIIVYRLNKAD